MLKDVVETKSIQVLKVTRYINGEFPRGRKGIWLHPLSQNVPKWQCADKSEIQAYLTLFLLCFSHGICYWLVPETAYWEMDFVLDSVHLFIYST